MDVKLSDIFAKGNWLTKSEIYIGLVFSSLSINILSLALPLVILQLYDRIIPNKSIDTLSLLVVGAIIAIFLENILKFCRDYISGVGENRLQKHYHNKVFSHLVNPTRQSNNFSYMLDKISILENIKLISNVNTISSISDIPFILIFLGIIYYINPLLFLVVSIVPCLLYWYSTRNQIKYIKHQIKQKNYSSEKNDLIFETIKNLTTIKYLGIEESTINKNEKWQNKLALENFDHTRFFGNLNRGITISAQITLIILVCISAWLVIQEQMSFGWMAACTILSSRTIFPLTRLIASLTKISVVKLLQHELKNLQMAELPTNKKPIQLSALPNIRLDNVSIACGLTNKTLLKNLNLDISFPKSLLILGSNNSGKNLLLQTIAGKSKPKTGTVFIDNKNIYTQNLSNLTNDVCLLDLGSEIFDGTIIENITLFDSRIDDELAKLTAEYIGLDLEINQLSQGYHTRIGNTATLNIPLKIKQLVIIARGLITQPKIILLDASYTAFNFIYLSKLIQKIKDKYITIITAPKLQFLPNVFDEVLLLKHNNINIVKLDKNPKINTFKLSSQNVVIKK